MHLDVRLLLKRTLTKDQKGLFAFQRDRLPILEDDNSEESSNFDYYKDIGKDIYRSEKVASEFTSLISKYHH